MELVLPTALDPDLAPAGKHLALCFTQFDPYQLAEGTWDTEREAYGRPIVSLLGEYMPGITSSVEHMEVLSPPDPEARYGLIGGNIMHGELSINQMFSFRPIPGYAGYRTPVAGLYLSAPAPTRAAASLAVPGRNAARAVLRDIRRSRFRPGPSRGAAGAPRGGR